MTLFEPMTITQQLTTLAAVTRDGDYKAALFLYNIYWLLPCRQLVSLTPDALGSVEHGFSGKHAPAGRYGRRAVRSG